MVDSDNVEIRYSLQPMMYYCDMIFVNVCK